MVKRTSTSQWGDRAISKDFLKVRVLICGFTACHSALKELGYVKV